MTQRKGSGLRRLSSPVAPHAFTSVCCFLVQRVDEMGLVEISPWAWILTRRGLR
jgi:hypothetical protein